MSDLSKNTQAILEELIRTYGDGGLWPTAAQWRHLLESGYTGKIVLHQFIKMKEFENEADLQALSSRYTDVSYELLETLGGKSGYVGLFECVWIGDSDEQWDAISMMEFPSIDALLKMFLNPRYIEVHHFRTQSTDRQKTLITRPLT